MQAGERRIPELDWAKGIAIVLVVVLHAQLFSGTLFRSQVILRGVPLFLVIFGINSELWFRAHAGDSLWTWYRERFARLMVPVWGAVTLWWAMAVFFGTVAGWQWWRIALAYLGYSPSIGISWFVTVILQLVVILPLLRWLVVVLGPVVMLLSSATLVVVSYHNVWPIIAALHSLLHATTPDSGFYYFWIFSPRVFWQVVAGIVIARFGVVPGWRTTIVAVALFIVAYLLSEEVFTTYVPRASAQHFANVPFTLSLLGLLTLMRDAPASIGRGLAWLGRSSWGIYLGQMIIHELIADMLGYRPGAMQESVRAGYAVLLLSGGIALTVLGDRIRATWLPAVLRR